MRERPILMSGPLVRAALDGRKTQTRRPIAPVQPRADGRWPAGRDPVPGCPYGQVGDRLWVRETFWAKHDTDSDGYQTIDCGPALHLSAEFHPGIQYVASPENPACPNEAGDWWEAPPNDWDGEGDYLGQGVQVWLPWQIYSKHPSIHMPRWASRLTLRITDVRVERVQDISEEDARAEGCSGTDGETTFYMAGRSSAPSPRAHFMSLWRSIYGADSWDRNDWVWALTFEREVTP